ncbi:Zinc finger CCHC domain-containing protein 8 [Platysternon megacephalum]|uniref:Zinc finger CCHC domain-containing protein 8 n=1 Tax=Platysternon megacephalum TaxID=55544 RepID=A0A4D9F426_9SAUR|nr:Zinc finger CCHC domain-containing protein 8 [Platysternon megacephalum]
MAAEVDFGDRELFEQLDGDEVATPTAQPLHIRFEEDEEAGEALRERLRDSEEIVRQLRSENILTGGIWAWFRFIPGQGTAPTAVYFRPMPVPFRRSLGGC